MIALSARSAHVVRVPTEKVQPYTARWRRPRLPVAMIVDPAGHGWLAVIEVGETGHPSARVSEVDDHAVVGCRLVGVGEPAQHVSRHVGEDDPLRPDGAEVLAQAYSAGSLACLIGHLPWPGYPAQALTAGLGSGVVSGSWGRAN